MFNPYLSNFSGISDMQNFCSGVCHVAKLKVNRKGIEGAAVTITPAPSSPAPDGITDVYTDFIVNGAFGYIITNPYDTVVFAGVVNGI